MGRYQILLTRTYVDDRENLKWCPSPNCIYAVECGVKRRDLGRTVPSVACTCKHRFCFGCALADHQPAPCSLVKQWIKKCEDDSETANWISANTKECPKCSSTIEKNGGCNHMTCRKCKHEFCLECIVEYLKNNYKLKCPMCRENYPKIFINNSSETSIEMSLPENYPNDIYIQSISL